MKPNVKTLLFMAVPLAIMDLLAKLAVALSFDPGAAAVLLPGLLDLGVAYHSQPFVADLGWVPAVSPLFYAFGLVALITLAPPERLDPLFRFGAGAVAGLVFAHLIELVWWGRVLDVLWIRLPSGYQLMTNLADLTGLVGGLMMVVGLGLEIVQTVSARWCLQPAD